MWGQIGQGVISITSFIVILIVILNNEILSFLKSMKTLLENQQHLNWFADLCWSPSLVKIVKVP